jgi:hypothetical protein
VWVIWLTVFCLDTNGLELLIETFFAHASGESAGGLERAVDVSKDDSEQAKMDLGNSSAHMGTILLVKHIKSVCSAVALRTR